MSQCDYREIRMSEIPWYSEASLVSPRHVFCVGSLAQCVRKWNTLAEIERISTHIRLAKQYEGRMKLDGGDVATLAVHPELKRV